MRSDGPRQEAEIQILACLAEHLHLDAEETGRVVAVMDILHASIVEPVVSA